MMQITTPVPGYTGEVAGVHFIDGVGDTSDARAIAYFARRGYGLGGAPEVVESEFVEDAPDSDESVAEEEPAPRGRRRT